MGKNSEKGSVSSAVLAYQSELRKQSRFERMMITGVVIFLLSMAGVTYKVIGSSNDLDGIDCSNKSNIETKRCQQKLEKVRSSWDSVSGRGTTGASFSLSGN